MENAPFTGGNENDAIALYKDYYRKHLPNVRTIEGLFAPDFDEEAYTVHSEDPSFQHSATDTSATIDRLTLYLSDLRKYTKCVVRAAQLRQLHYTNYILHNNGKEFAGKETVGKETAGKETAGKKTEDSGHRAWREGMNAVAEDCQRKLEYWSLQHEKLLAKFIDDMSVQDTHDWTDQTDRTDPKSVLDLTARNCDYCIKEVKRSKKIVLPPKASAAERARVRTEYKRQLLEKNEADDALISVEIGRYKEYNDLLLSYNSYRSADAVPYPARDLHDLCLRKRFDDPAAIDTSTIDFNRAIVLVGLYDEMHDLAVYFYNCLVTMQFEYCAKSGCTLHRKCEYKMSPGGCINPYEYLGLGPDNIHYCTTNDALSESNPVLDQKLRFIIEMIRLVSENGEFIKVAMPIIINCILTDHRIEWRCTFVYFTMNAIISNMCDDTFIANYLAAVEKRDNVHKVIQYTSKLSQPIETLNITIKGLLRHYKNLGFYINTLTHLYPNALYFDRINVITQLIDSNNVMYGTQIVRNSRQWIDPPIVNYLLIKRKTGLKLKVGSKTLQLYNEIYQKYTKMLNDEKKRLGVVV